MITDTTYIVSWESDTQRNRKDAFFGSLTMAEQWYNEKLEEGKKPQLWIEEVTVTREKLK